MDKIQNFEETPTISELVVQKDNALISTPKPVEIVHEDIDPTEQDRKMWAQLSNEHYNKYIYGLQLGKMNKSLKNEKDIKNLFKSLGVAVESMIANEFSLDGQSTEKLSDHFTILHSVLFCLANDMINANLETVEVTKLSATLHGFINSYVDKLTNKGY